MASFRVSSDLAVIAVCDGAVMLPSGTDQAALVRELDALVATGKLFYLITDDPVTYRIELLSDGAAPVSAVQELEPAGGSFGLELPSGSVVVAGWRTDGTPSIAGALEVRPGVHTLKVHTRRPFDGPRYTAHMASLLGRDWAHIQRVNKLGLVGCLPLLGTAIAIVAQRWRVLAFIAPMVLLSYLPYFVLRQSRRYRDAERRVQAESDSWPNFAFSFAPSSQRLDSGFLRV